MNAPKTARFTLVGSALFALVLGGIFFSACEVQTVYFVNGLDVPVVVTVDGGGTMSINSGWRGSRSLSEGLHRVEVKTADGKPLEEGELYVKSSSDRAVAWNVLGAAPLYVQSHVYTRYSSSSGSKPQVSTYAGARLVDRENVEYIFSEPPSSISTKDKSGGAIVKMQLAQAPGGWRTSLSMLEQSGSHASLAKLGEALLQVDPTQEEAFDAALTGWYAGEGAEAALAFLRRTMKAHPDLIVAHEKYQLLLQSLGQREHVRAFYEGLWKKAPESVVAGYLLSQVEPPAEALARLEKLVEREPTRKRMRMERARLRFLTGRYEEAVADFDAVLDPKEAAEAEEVSAYLRSLVALGRVPAALTLAVQFGEEGKKMDYRLAVLYGRLMGFVPKKDWPKGFQFFVDRASEGRSDELMPVWIAGRLGIEVTEPQLRNLPSDEMRKAFAIQRAAWKSAETAWTECHTATVGAMDMLDKPTTLLLAAEFERVGDPVLAGKLLGTLALLTPLSHQELRAAVFAPDGEAVVEHLDPELRAAVLLARARRLDAEGLDSSDTYEMVTNDDILKGVVTSALREWERPKPVIMVDPANVLRLEGQRTEAVSDGAPR